MKIFAAITCASLMPSLALAHAGGHRHSAPTHALTEPDHLAVLGLAVVLGFIVWAWRRRRS